MSENSENRGRGRRGAPDPTANDDTIRRLIAAKVRFLVPMLIIYMVGYIGLTVLAGFAKGFMALKVVGSLNLGFVLIAFNYLLSWVLAIVYAHVANTVFDPMIERVIVRTAKHGGRP